VNRTDDIDELGASANLATRSRFSPRIACTRNAGIARSKETAHHRRAQGAAKVNGAERRQAAFVHDEQAFESMAFEMRDREATMTAAPITSAGRCRLHTNSFARKAKISNQSH